MWSSSESSSVSLVVTSPSASGSRRAWRRGLRGALGRVGGPFAEPPLRGYGHLLRAELLGQLGQTDEAREALAAARKADPPPPVPAMLEAQIAIALEQRRFDEALK